jgi:flagellar biosynthesis/type III secretory pathway chaperone
MADTTSWQNLIDVLEKQLELYTDSLDISRNKKDVLITGNIDSLKAFTKQEESLIFNLGKLEQKRQAIVREIGKQYGLSGKTLSLTAVSELADEESAQRLEALSEELVAVFQQMAPLTLTNTRLIEQALTFVNLNLNLLTTTTTAPTYAGQGNMVEPAGKTRLMVDRKI